MLCADGGATLDETDTARYLAIQDTGLLRTMRLHNIERHTIQLTPEQGVELLRAAAEQGAIHGAQHHHHDGSTVVEPVRDPDQG